MSPISTRSRFPAAAGAALACLCLLLAGCRLGQPAPGAAGPADASGLIFPGQPGAEAPEEGFRVAEYAPGGTVPWENVEGGIWVMFSRPVVPLARVGQPAASSELVQIYPPVAGVYRWYGSRLLSFEPAGALAPATQYLVAVKSSLVSLEGAPLQGFNAFRFFTPPLEMVQIEPSGSDVAPEDCREIRVSFSYPVDVRSVSRSLRLEAAGREVAFTAAYARPAEASDQAGADPAARRQLVLSLRKELPWDSEVTVRLLAGARPGPEPGYYGTEAEQALSFHTLEPLALSRADVYDWLPAVAAVLVFNHPLEEQSVLSRLRVELPGYALEGNVETSGGAIYLNNLPVPFESTFRVRLLAGLRDIYGQELSREESLELEVGPAPGYVRVRAEGHRVLEAGFPALAVVEFQNALSGAWSAGRLANPFAELPAGAFRSYGVESLPRNTRLFRAVDFSQYLNAEGLGSVFARFRFSVPSWWSDEPDPVDADLRLQVTDLGLTSHVANNRLTVRAASLATGRPVTGAQVQVRGPGGELAPRATDPQGVASFVLGPGELARLSGGSAERLEELEVSATKGTDRFSFRLGEAPSHDWNLSATLEAEEPQAVTYLASDRGIYRPGEELAFYGIDRDLGPAGLQERRGRYSVVLRQGWDRDAVRGQAGGSLSPSGRFWGRLTLPENLEPDEYFLVYSRADGRQTGWAPVRLAFFRRVNFAVELALPEGLHLVGDHLEGRFSGKYLAGGNVNRGQWSYWWARRPVSWSPPDPEGVYQAFRFGATRDYESWDEYYEADEGYYEELSSGEGSLSGDGTVTAPQELAAGEPGRVYEYTLTATVEDVDRQAISRQGSVEVFTSQLLIGARLSGLDGGEESLYFVGRGEPFLLQMCQIDPEGGAYPTASALEGRLLREDWSLVRERGAGGTVDTRWQRREIEEASFQLQPAARLDSRGRRLAGRELATSQVGAYIVELRGRDRQGREALTRLDFYSTGSANVLWQRYDENRIDLVADRSEYAPGQRARLLIKSPLERGSYLLSVEREGILEERLLELEGSTSTVEVDIAEEHVPVVYVSLTSWSGRTAAPPEGPDLPDLGKPRGCFGSLALPVQTSQRRIRLELEPSQVSYRPGAEAELTVRASWQGKPLAGAEIAVVAADRGVLDLIDYHLPDPVGLFYNRGLYRNAVAHYDSRAMLMDPVLWKVRDLPGGDKEGAEADAEGFPELRRDFRAAAVFEPSLVTGPDGTARLRFRLPDQLTTFRATAVGVKGNLFGLGESEIRVQNPINVRTALPRSLRSGDRATAGVVVTNLDAQTQAVSIRLETQGLTLEGRGEQRVSLKSGESREVAFQLRAGDPGTARLGTARLLFTVDSAVLKERLEASLRVERSSLQESFTIVGQTEGEVREGLVVPESFLGLPEEGLYLTLDSTIASSLTQAVQFLSVYPYDCLEQRTSKLFAWLLYDWLQEDRGAVDRELAELPRYQTEGGGMSFWADPGYRRADYYVSLRTAHLLELARARGQALPAGLDRKRLLEYLREQYPAGRPYLQSYCLYVLSLAGNDTAGEARKLLKESDGLGVTEWAFLGLALHRVGRQQEAQGLLGRIRDSLRVATRSVTFSGLGGRAGRYGYYGGELQAKALVLMLYQALEPSSQIAQALADDLLAASRKGHWGNTSDTGWALQAFAAWLEAGGELEADFRARVTLGAGELAAESFRGLSRQPVTRTIDAPALLELARREAAGQGRDAGGVLPLVFSKEGRGRLYYAASLRYALEAAGAEARDEGIGLFTEVLDLEGKPVAQALRLGQVYRLRAVLYSSRDRDYLALRLPIPSGAEAVDGSLATSQIVRGAEEDEPEYWGPVRRVYDNEVRFFFDSFLRGKQEVSFLFRATTPGSYPTPPATAELMYEPEVFGRTAGREWRIVP